jgi:NCS2 family nucleobase:cation symporter-2
MKEKTYRPAHSASPADEVLPPARTVTLGFQHVLVMYAAAIAVPLIIGGALKLPKEQIASLISADLFVSGLITMIQTMGMRWFGIRLPIVMGCSFTGIGAMIAIGANPGLGLASVFGALFVAGIIVVLIAPLIARFMRFFPPLVVGTILLAIGISLMEVSVMWTGGGFDAKDFGHPKYIAVAAAVLMFVLLMTKYATGFLQSIAVLLGIVFGVLVCLPFGLVDLSQVGKADWVGLVRPFSFGAFRFDPWAIVSMTVVMLVNVIETGGVFLAVGQMTGKPVGEPDLVRGFRTDGLGAILGAVFNIFPYTSYSENLGLMEVTGVRSRWVCAMSGAILILLALVPKLSALVAAVPVFVLGGVGMIMFGIIAVAGIRMLRGVDFESQPLNGFLVAVSISVGMIPSFSKHFFDQFPPQLSPLLQSGIVLAAVTAVLLNVLISGGSAKAEQPVGAGLAEKLPVH